MGGTNLTSDFQLCTHKNDYSTEISVRGLSPPRHTRGQRLTDNGSPKANKRPRHYVV